MSMAVKLWCSWTLPVPFYLFNLYVSSLSADYKFRNLAGNGPKCCPTNNHMSPTGWEPQVSAYAARITFPPTNSAIVAHHASNTEIKLIRLAGAGGKKPISPTWDAKGRWMRQLLSDVMKVNNDISNIRCRPGLENLYKKQKIDGPADSIKISGLCARRAGRLWLLPEY